MSFRTEDKSRIDPHLPPSQEQNEYMPDIEGQDVAADSLPVYPGTAWEEASPQDTEWSARKLGEAHAYFKILPTASMVVVDRGKVVAEWGDPTRRVKVSSVRKSLLNALYGIAVARGQINLNETLASLGIDDDPPLTPKEKQATVRMLLQSRSGVYHSYVGGLPAIRAMTPERGSHDPGTFWHYNNWDFNALGTIYESQLQTMIREAFHKQVAKPLQMQDFRAEDAYYIRSAADALTQERSVHSAYHFRLSARDLARFGYLYLQRGRWNGVQIVPSNWVKESTHSYSDVGDGRGYGYLWWTNSLTLPVHSFDAFGALAKYIFVLPERGLVVVYLNHVEFPDDSSRISQGELNALPTVSTSQLNALMNLLLSAQHKP